MSRGQGTGHTAGILIGAALAAGAARGAYALLRARPPGGSAAWTRTNHRGEPVTLLEGPAAAAGAALAAALTPGLPRRARAGLVAAAAGAGAFGGYDDLAGSGGRRGFRGHLGALAHGEVTTGAVKLGGIGATGLAASALLGGGALDVTVNAGLIAGGANLLNLFDLRPGRAIKVATLAGGLLAAAGRPWRAGGVLASAGPVSGNPVSGNPVSGSVTRCPVTRCWPGRFREPRWRGFRWVRRLRWRARTWASGPCSATPGRTRSGPCSALRRPRACRGPAGSPCWPGSSRSPRPARR